VGIFWRYRKYASGKMNKEITGIAMREESPGTRAGMRR